ncbi:MAG: HPr family phosphocarrier protein [Eubacterium sp.]|nr:HPr family phosphocarrier protein [Eubacterium sp.]MDD7210591.1 HPr family phosphocarrier protein [Lachnospiraceae bacterium]MDY5497168.1 HPr family phosphocarrier protein [Anaerobutyricum sp.]
MITKTIKINSMNKVKTFVDIINKFSGRFDLVSGCSMVNAKSVMGIFSLDISRPLYLYIYNEENAEPVSEAISEFEVLPLQEQTFA